MISYCSVVLDDIHYNGYVVIGRRGQAQERASGVNAFGGSLSEWKRAQAGQTGFVAARKRN